MAEKKEKWKIYPDDLISAHAILNNHTDTKAYNVEKKRRAEEAKKSKQKSYKPPPSEQHEQHQQQARMMKCHCCGGPHHSSKCNLAKNTPKKDWFINKAMDAYSNAQTMDDVRGHWRH